MSKESDTDLPSLISESSDTVEDATQQPSHARVAPVLPPPTATKVNKLCHRHSNIEVTLDGKELWDEFYRRGTEMIVNRSGRRMFPGFSVSISGLRPKGKYTMKLDVVLADNHRFKFLNARWLAVGSSEPQPAYETYIHTDSPNTGSFWMRHGVSFRKLKITNNKDKPGQNALLHSMHKYFIRLVIDEERKSPPGEPKPVPRPILTMEFPETTFIAVTAYQNEEVTQLKISNNPFAKAFRESVADMDWETAQALYNTCSPSSYGVGMTHSGNYFSHSPWGIQSPMVSPVPHTPLAMQPVPHTPSTMQPVPHTPSTMQPVPHTPSTMQPVPHIPSTMQAYSHFQLHQQQIPVHHQSLSRLQYSPESPLLGNSTPLTAKESEYFKWPMATYTKTELINLSSDNYHLQTYGQQRHIDDGSCSSSPYLRVPPSINLPQLPDFNSVFTPSLDV